MTRAILLGDSHIAALKRAEEDGHPVAADLEFKPFGKGSHSTVPFFNLRKQARAVAITHPELRKHKFRADQFGGEGEPSHVFLLLPVNTSRFLRDGSWNTHVPSAWFDRHSKLLSVSEAVVDRLIDADSRHALDFAVALRSVGIPVAVIESPRLFPNAIYFNRHPREVCQWLDQRYRERVLARLDQAGIDVIRQPAATIGSDGMTLIEYQREDPHDTYHANARYGALVLDDIGTFLSGHHS